MNRMARLLGLTLFAVIAATACDRDGSSNTNTDPVAEQKATVLLDALKAGDMDTALAQYHEGFFLSRSPAQWRDQLAALSAERGTLQAYILRRSQADTRLSGKFYILEYEGVYSGRQRVNHTLTLISHVEGGEIQLVGHKLTPWEVEE